MKRPSPNPVDRADYHNPALHRAIMELYASFSDHKYACAVHLMARMLRG